MPEMGRTIQTSDLADGSVTSAKIKDAEIVNADIAALAAIAYSKLATDPRITRIKTIQFTGDGQTSNPITGVGFQSEIVMIWEHVTTEGGACKLWLKMNQFGTAWAWYDVSYKMYENRIPSLDADGFTVGSSAEPNVNGAVYDALCLG